MSSALLTDLYELTMAAAYLADGRAEEAATFDLYFRKVPDGVDLVINAGLDPVLDYLEGLRFTAEDLAYLESIGRFEPAFLDYLGRLRFTGDVWAVPEGLPVFPGEPILRVSASLVQAQIVETFLINRVAYSSLIASNAAQIRVAAGGTPLLEFGARRAHGPDGAITAARAAVIGGCAATSNVEAARRYRLETSGTQAHSFVMAYEDELSAFRAFARAFPDHCVLLVDTYDTLRSGVPNAVRVAQELGNRGHRLQGVRLDSGDLVELSRQTRRMLDEAGFTDARVLASGDLDAERIAALEAAGAPIDGYGVGTALSAAAPDPTFSGVYKLAEVGGRPVMKLSGDPDKLTDPGRKQVWRDERGDVIGLADEDLKGEPLLQPVMADGRRRAAPLPVPELAERCRRNDAALRPKVNAGSWTVGRSPALLAARERLMRELGAAPV